MLVTVLTCLNDNKTSILYDKYGYNDYLFKSILLNKQIQVCTNN